MESSRRPEHHVTAIPPEGQDNRLFSQLSPEEQVQVAESVPLTSWGMDAFKLPEAWESQARFWFVLKNVAKPVGKQAISSFVVLNIAIAGIAGSMRVVPLSNPVFKGTIIFAAVTSFLFIIAGVKKALDAEQQFSRAARYAIDKASLAEVKASEARSGGARG
jgi:hypothetical protein